VQPPTEATPPKLIALEQIRAVLPSLDLIPIIETGFVEYSAGKAVIPPVGELLFDRGDVHIKYGYIKGGEYYVIKIASGFYGNAAFGLPSGNGLMLLFRQKTGELASILLDQGHLTDVRTAVAGAIAAKHLAPKNVERIGIVGAGTQARLQLRHLRTVVACRDALVAGLTEDEVVRYKQDLEHDGFRVATTLDPSEILPACNLVVTATPSTQPLLHAGELRPGAHITAVGSDTPFKQELDVEILARADVIVADSIAQCRDRGEIHKALDTKAITPDKLVELGDVIAGRAPGRRSESDITVADLTGVAVQDIQIATAIVRGLA
jgi:ornithine cyclodeaminase